MLFPQSKLPWHIKITFKNLKGQNCDFASKWLEKKGSFLVSSSDVIQKILRKHEEGDQEGYLIASYDPTTSLAWGWEFEQQTSGVQIPGVAQWWMLNFQFDGYNYCAISHFERGI